MELNNLKFKTIHGIEYIIKYHSEDRYRLYPIKGYPNGGYGEWKEVDIKKNLGKDWTIVTDIVEDFQIY